MSAGEQNWANRTIWTADNLDILRGLNSESVDLIYLDPPFNSDRDYEAPVGSQSAGVAFKDTWTLDDVSLASHGELAERSPKIYAVIDAAGIAHSKSMKAYLIMMAVRLLEMERILKPTGSLYLHCDDTSLAWLCVLGDALLTRRNLITWRRSSRSDGRRFGRCADHILFYTKTNDYTWNAPYEEEVRKGAKRDNLTGPGTSMGESGKPWRGYDPGKIGRHWSAPRTGRFAAWLEAHRIEGYRRIRSVHARLEALAAAGLIHWTKNGTPQLVYPPEFPRRTRVNSVWCDVKPIGPTSKERKGHPTQKPEALLERIIQASSNPGDVVLDPFCGCATTLVAAEKLGRKWAGIDLGKKAVALVHERLAKTVGVFGRIAALTSSPMRSDLGELPDYRTHKHTLYGKQEGVCGGCRTQFPFRNMTVDHIVPLSKGGNDHIANLQLLCGACNSTKGTGTQAELSAKLRRQKIIV